MLVACRVCSNHVWLEVRTTRRWVAASEEESRVLAVRHPSGDMVEYRCDTCGRKATMEQTRALLAISRSEQPQHGGEVEEVSHPTVPNKKVRVRKPLGIK